MSVDLAKRSEMRLALFQLEAIIEGKHANEYIIIEGMRIDVQHMVLDMSSEHKPHFFDAYDRLPELDEEDRDDLDAVLDSESYMEPLDRAYPIEYTLESYTFHTIWSKLDEYLWTSKDVGDYKPYKSLYQLPRGDCITPKEFGVFRMTEVASKKLPHTKAVAYHELVPSHEKHFLRGELLISLRIMLGQLKKKRYRPHMIAPVLLFSIIGSHGRVLESYFDGKHLVLRRTKMYDFRNDPSTFKDFAEWYLSNPTGDTTSLMKEFVPRPHD